MSKIQEAIRKLQAMPKSGSKIPMATDSPKAPEKQEGSSEDSLTVAILRHEQMDATGKFVVDDRPIVDVDYDLLRSGGLLAPVDQQRHIADQYRIIKRPLLDNAMGKNAHQSDDANLIMVASALSGDGKTFNCINLALSMATEKDTSVLLVDADVAKPHISTFFGLAKYYSVMHLWAFWCIPFEIWHLRS